MQGLLHFTMGYNITRTSVSREDSSDEEKTKNFEYDI